MLIKYNIKLVLTKSLVGVVYRDVGYINGLYSPIAQSVRASDCKGVSKNFLTKNLLV